MLAYRLMRQEKRPRSIGAEFAGYAAQDEFPQARMAKAAHDGQISTRCERVGIDRCRHTTLRERQINDIRFDAVTGNMFGGVSSRDSAGSALFAHYANDIDFLNARKKAKGITQRTGGDGCAILGDTKPLNIFRLPGG